VSPRRVLLGWLGIELGAATLAAAVLVAGLPLVLAIFSYEERDVWALIATVGSLSVPVAVLLAKSALRVSQDLLSGRS
jgi:hypothetical protein